MDLKRKHVNNGNGTKKHRSDASSSSSLNVLEFLEFVPGLRDVKIREILKKRNF